MAPAPESRKCPTFKLHHLHVVTAFACGSETVEFQLSLSLSNSSSLLHHDGYRLQMLPALGSILLRARREWQLRS